MTIIELLEELNRNPEGQELLKTVKKPEDIEKYAAVLADISARCGIEVNQAEIFSMIQAEEAERSRRYKAAQEEIAELADDDVEDVVGGVYRLVFNKFTGATSRVEGCAHDYTDDDCAIQDACDHVLEIYYGCSSGYHQECKNNNWFPVKV